MLCLDLNAKNNEHRENLIDILSCHLTVWEGQQGVKEQRTDLEGLCVLSCLTSLGEASLDTSSLSSGIYFLTLITKNGVCKTYRLIKN